MDARRGDPDANAAVKAILGTSAATGQAVVPGNFVAEVAAITSMGNPYRQLMNVQQVRAGLAVDIPYETTGLAAALLQGAYGSNKDNRDHSFGEAVATLYTIATIVDVGNQLLRHSEGAAEASVGAAWASTSAWPRATSSSMSPAARSRWASSRRCSPTATSRPTSTPSPPSHGRLPSATAWPTSRAGACGRRPR